MVRIYEEDREWGSIWDYCKYQDDNDPWDHEDLKNHPLVISSTGWVYFIKHKRDGTHRLERWITVEEKEKRDKKAAEEYQKKKWKKEYAFWEKELDGKTDEEIEEYWKEKRRIMKENAQKSMEEGKERKTREVREGKERIQKLKRNLREYGLTINPNDFAIE